jgi:hypothetical protein
LDDIFHCYGRLLPHTFFIALGCVWSRPGYFESELETDKADLELETNTTALELEMDAAALELDKYIVVLDLETETDVVQEISKQERYSVD